MLEEQLRKKDVQLAQKDEEIARKDEDLAQKDGIITQQCGMHGAQRAREPLGRRAGPRAVHVVVKIHAGPAVAGRS